MERQAQRTLDGLRIGAAAVSPLGEKAAQQMIQFPRNFLMDCSSLRRPPVAPCAARQD
jgi:hypothetical protein